MSRDQRRAVLKDALKEYSRGGYNPDRLMTIFGFVQELAETLGRRGNMRRASAAGAFAVKTYEITSKKYGFKGEVHCKKGCGYCCHTRVTATPIELFMLARGIRDRWNDASDPLKERFRGVEAQTRTLPKDQWVSSRIPCAFLAEGSCSIYEVRPLTCRTYASTSLPTCIDWFNNAPVVVPQPELNQRMRVFILAGMKAALADAGLENLGYEMAHGVEVALAPDAEARWLAGEPVFAGVANDSTTARPGGRQAGHEAFDLLVDVLKTGAFGKDMPPNPWFSW
jgi:Fe-S-cluster containining protein